MYRHSEPHEIKYHGSQCRSVEIGKTASPLSDGVVFQVGIALQATVGNPTQVVAKAHTDFFGESFVDEAKVAMGPPQNALQELWILREFI